jgi:hypothetical protein
VAIEYVDAYKKSMLAEEQTKYGKEQQQVDISWKPPTTGWFDLNTNGAAKTGVGKTGCGGVL